MELKKNYFLRNMVDVEKNLSTYLKDADFNYVILEKNIPLVWGDKTPIVFGGEIDVQNELVGLDALNENGTLKDDFKVMTELEFIETFCLIEVVNFIKKKTLCDGVFDGVNMVVNTDNTFNNLVNFNNMTDILGIYANMNGHDEPSVLVSSNDDTKKEFIYVSKLPMDVIIKLIEFLEKEI